MEAETARGAEDGEGQAPLGLRERKKLETRKRIAKAALALSEKQGFEATTVNQIAAAADVSPRTVFGYFPTKESIIFGDSEEFLEGLEARLEKRADGETVTEALRAWVLGIVEDREDKEAELVERRRQLIDAELSLRAYERLVLQRAETIIAGQVAGEIGSEPGDILPQMVGAATVAALDSIGRNMKDLSREQALAMIEDLVDDAITFIAGGIGALAAPHAERG